MKPEFTNDGLDIQSFDEIFEELSDEYKSIYGNDIVIDQDSPDGQRIGIESTMMLDLQSFLNHLYNSIDPDLASGDFLNKILKFSGLFRRPASQSQWDLEVTVSQDLTLPSGYTVKDQLGQEWSISTATPITIAGNPNTVTFKSVTYGSVVGLTGYAIEQVNYEPNVTLIEATTDSTVGIEEETDQEVRIRRNLSLENPAYSTVGSLFARLANLPGVTDLVVYENQTDVYDSDLDLDGHSIWCVIEGGTVADIAELIVKNKTAGTGLKGSEEETYNEVLIRPDASTFTVQHIVRYDRPTEVDLYVNVNASRVNPTESIDIDAIKNGLAEKDYNIGDDAIASQLYEYGYSGGSNYVLSDLEISDDDITYIDGLIDGGSGSKFTISTTNITVTEI